MGHVDHGSKSATHCHLCLGQTVNRRRLIARLLTPLTGTTELRLRCRLAAGIVSETMREEAVDHFVAKQLAGRRPRQFLDESDSAAQSLVRRNPLCTTTYASRGHSAIAELLVPFWYRLTRVVLDKGPLNGCVCVCVRACVRACVCVCCYSLVL